MLYNILFKITRRIFSYRSPVIAVLESYFSDKNFTRIIAQSLGLIQPINLPIAELNHTEVDFESVVTTLTMLYSKNILILHNPTAWRLNTHVQSIAKRHDTFLWPIYVLQR